MPELPEVETVVRTLRPGLVDARVELVWTSGKALRLGRPVDTAALRRFSIGARVRAVRRIAKYILVDVDTRDGETAAWLVHLGMSGRLRLQPSQAERAPHTHVVWRLDGARELRFSDPRRFGLVKAAASAGKWSELRLLGPDPLQDLTPEVLREALAASRAPLKSFLLDQKRIAGLGNIYVSEALHHARLFPGLAAYRAVDAAEVLCESIRRVLNEALENRGTTLRDFIDSDGHTGTHQDALWVYGREGLTCRTCGEKILRRVDGGRSTFFCPRCQPKKAARTKTTG